ncbi:MAG: hypothetical protein GXY97_01020 [Clostridiales bacterium]|jgi:hypothetical protein|nr:hypothetical protein [Clostridiales bacterium]HOC09494.1 hypothetical protein [Bacillota bacterium]
MDSGSVFLNYLILVSILIQGFYLFIIKRRDKNFYRDSGPLNMLSTGLGIILMIYNYMLLWEFEIGNDSDAKTAVMLLGILVTIAILFILKNLFSGKKYTATNIDRDKLETILAEVLGEYELTYKKTKDHPQSMVTKITLEEYDSFIEVTQRGSGGRAFVLEFNGLDQLYDFENIIEDLKERINDTTKANRFRGIGDLAAVAGILVFFAWVRITRP